MEKFLLLLILSLEGMIETIPRSRGTRYKNINRLARESRVTHYRTKLFSRAHSSPVILLLVRTHTVRGSNDYHRVVFGAIVGAPPRDDTSLLVGVGLVDTARRPLLFVCIYPASSRGAAGLHRVHSEKGKGR